MRDTPPEVQAQFERMIMQRSGEERLKMGCSMNASSRELIRASLVGKDPVALKKALFLRLYGDDFGPKERKKILLALRGVAIRKRMKAIEVVDASKRTIGKSQSGISDLAIVKPARSGAVRDAAETYGRKRKASKPSQRARKKYKPEPSG